MSQSFNRECELQAHENEMEEEEDRAQPGEENIPCPKCGGSGTCYEGWDCWYCDGQGYIEL